MFLTSFFFSLSENNALRPRVIAVIAPAANKAPPATAAPFLTPLTYLNIFRFNNV